MIDFFINLIGNDIVNYPFLLCAVAIIPVSVVFFMFYTIFYDLVRFR